MTKIRRINLIGAAGTSKSTLAAQIYHHFKVKTGPYIFELVRETIKLLAYQNVKPKGFHGLEIAVQQLRAEEIFLANGVDIIVTDCPLILGAFYSKLAGKEFWPELLSISDQFDNKYFPCNILLNRGSLPYQQKGRYETFKEALEVDKKLWEFIEDNSEIPYTEFDSRDSVGILNFLEKEIYGGK